MEDLTGALKPGNQTSEYATAKATGTIATIVTVVGFIMLFLPQVTSLVEGTAAQTYVAGFIAFVGMASRVLVSLGYMKTRETIKRFAIEHTPVDPS